MGNREQVYTVRHHKDGHSIRVVAIGVMPSPSRYGLPVYTDLYREDLNKFYYLDVDGATWVERVGGAGSLNIQELDGVPSVSGVSSLIVDQSDGFVLTDLGAGVARLDLAAIPATLLADWTVTSPAALGADQTAYNPGDFDVYRLSSDAERIIHGVLASLGRVRPRRFANVGANNIRLGHQSGTEGTAANRLLCQGAADVLLFPNEQAELWYDATTARWRVVLV